MNTVNITDNEAKENGVKEASHKYSQTSENQLNLARGKSLTLTYDHHASVDQGGKELNIGCLILAEGIIIGSKWIYLISD